MRHKPTDVNISQDYIQGERRGRGLIQNTSTIKIEFSNVDLYISSKLDAECSILYEGGFVML